MLRKIDGILLLLFMHHLDTIFLALERMVDRGREAGDNAMI